jgi:phosphoribosylglycinamide formyltransferase-1
LKRLIIFASGSGSNAENIIRYFNSNKNICISKILTNNKNAKVIERGKKLNINTVVFNKDDFYQTDKILNLLKNDADYIVLAGFLWKIPKNIIDAFPNKIINIHPALLPKYGGKGMYGNHIHKKVIENKEKETGITIHYVNEKYDDGTIIFQKSVSLSNNETLKNIQKKIHQLEMENFPKVIEKEILING